MMPENRVGQGPSLRQWYFSCPARIRALSMLFGAVGFGVMELMHWALVRDLGRRSERLTAELLAACVIAVLLSKLLCNALRVRRLTMVRFEIIRDMNHHVRNALQVISFSCRCDTTMENMVTEITNSVQRIDWALREILSREEPGVHDSEGGKAANA